MTELCPIKVFAKKSAWFLPWFYMINLLDDCKALVHGQWHPQEQCSCLHQNMCELGHWHGGSVLTPWKCWSLILISIPIKAGKMFLLFVKLRFRFVPFFGLHELAFIQATFLFDEEHFSDVRGRIFEHLPLTTNKRGLSNSSHFPLSTQHWLTGNWVKGAST